MATATIYRWYQITLPESDDPRQALREWLEQAREHPEAFEVLFQCEVDGELNK